MVNRVGDWYLDRENFSYVKPPVTGHARQLRAPLGNRVVLIGAEGELTLTDVTGGNLVVVADPQRIGGVSWSPTGDRLVGQIIASETGADGQDFRMGFGVIDAASGALTKHWIDLNNYDCSDCRFAFSRDGREIVLAIANRLRGENAELVDSLQLFDAATGEPSRSLPVKAMPSSPFSWSPDGRYVIANPDVLQTQYELIEVATGKARPFAHDAVWVTDDLLLAVQNATVHTLRPNGSTVGTAELGGAFTGLSEVVLGPPD
jgi:hypothetical protein